MESSGLAAAVVASFLAGLDDLDLRRTACRRIAQLLQSAPPSNASPAVAPMSSPCPGLEFPLPEVQKRVLLDAGLLEPQGIEARLSEPDVAIAASTVPTHGGAPGATPTGGRDHALD